jgi:hypothetical protein
MNMKKILFSLFVIAISVAATAQKTINDPNVQARTVSGFHALQVSSAFDVYLSQGEEALAVSAEDTKYLQYIETTVDNGVLIIRYNEKGLRLGNRKLRAYVSAKNLDEIRASGATDVLIEGTMNLSKLNLHLSGASDLKGHLNVNGPLIVHLSGASDLDIKGSAGEVSIDASGASDVNGYDFTASTCKVDASGSCDVKISVDKELSVSLNGSSSVYYKGNAVIRNVKTSGSSEVSKKS